MLYGYARVSKTEDQDTLTQINALKLAGVKKLFEERASGGRWDRPQLHKMLDQLREGDVVIVWKLDRLSRSLKDLLHIIEKIEGVGAGFRSITEAIDTTTPAGRMMMQMVGSFAEFERAMIRERTKAGLETARAQGRVGGRKHKLTATQQKEAVAMVTSTKKSASDVARLFRVHPATISRLLSKADINVVTAPIEKTIKVKLYLEVENNNKFIRGKKRAREDIEIFVLSDYEMKKLNECEYQLVISYETEEDLEKKIYNIMSRAGSHADTRNCFTESDVTEINGDRRWQ
ncbi:hypothetical protein BH10PSE19_BH10PSE19_17070 [soil metagenome]